MPARHPTGMTPASDRRREAIRLGLDGKAVLVTGAASGIGAACAELAAHAGAAVFAVDRDEERVAEVAGRIGAAHEPCDVADVDALPVLVERCVEVLGRLDGLVNAAGVFQTREMLDITPAEFDRIFAVNVRGLFFLQQAAARAMIPGGGGSIVNFSSVAARVPRPISSHYAAAKAAVISLTRSAAVAWARHGVRVNSVLPGTIDTPMIQAILRDRAGSAEAAADLEEEWRAMIPMGRLGTPQEVAHMVVFLVSDASGYVTGESIGITGGSDDV